MALVQAAPFKSALDELCVVKKQTITGSVETSFTLKSGAIYLVYGGTKNRTSAQCFALMVLIDSSLTSDSTNGIVELEKGSLSSYKQKSGALYMTSSANTDVTIFRIA